MTTKKSTKRALLSSVLATVLCAAMLIGTTFAWFTDSVISGKNRIVAGNLDVDLIMDKLDGEGYVSIADGEGDIFQEADVAQNSNATLWEPGKTQIVYLGVQNKGSLALKYNILLQVTDGGLIGSLEYAVIDGIKAADLTAANWTELKAAASSTGDIAAGSMIAAPNGCLDEIVNGQANETDYFALAVHMKEEAGNQYQAKDITIDLTVVATQATAESDSFDNQYDKEAPLDFVPVANADELQNAIDAGKAVSLTAPVELEGALQATGDVTINGNGNALTIPSGTDRVINITGTENPVTIALSNVDIQGPTTGSYTRGISIYDAKKVKLVMDNCSLSANYYALNVASASDEAEVVIRNSTLSGWCAFQTHSPNANVTFENCTLVGLNDKGYNAEGWNDFATVVINEFSEGNPDPEGAHDGTFTFKNCRIEANQTTGNKQYFLSVRAKNTTLIAENCTFYVDGERISQDKVPDYVAVYPEVMESFQFTLR